jgi:outer membrane protein assembly factor BamD
MFLKILFTLISLVFIIGCSSNQKSTLENNVIKNPESEYVQAMIKFDNQQYEDALDIFKSIEKIYPLSNEAIQSQIMSGFIDYIKLDYDSAIIKFNKLINKYPSLKNIDYVYYMKALCYYEQISHQELDSAYNNLALKNLKQVTNRFPNSQYAKDSYQKIILVKSNIAAKHMSIGRFYQKNKKYTAALNRYNKVLKNFSETKFTPEALHRVSEIYYSIGMIEEAKNTAAILGHNYPNSEWYKFSYKNLTKDENNSIFSNSFNKIFTNE